MCPYGITMDTVRGPSDAPDATGEIAQSQGASKPRKRYPYTEGGLQSELIRVYFPDGTSELHTPETAARIETELRACATKQGESRLPPPPPYVGDLVKRGY